MFTREFSETSDGFFTEANFNMQQGTKVTLAMCLTGHLFYLLDKDNAHQLTKWL